eukprot:gene10174-7126_t
MKGLKNEQKKKPITKSWQQEGNQNEKDPCHSAAVLPLSCYAPVSGAPPNVEGGYRRIIVRESKFVYEKPAVVLHLNLRSYYRLIAFRETLRVSFPACALGKIRRGGFPPRPPRFAAAPPFAAKRVRLIGKCPYCLGSWRGTPPLYARKASRFIPWF